MLKMVMVATAMVGLGSLGLGVSPARAADNAMQVCGAKYQAAKAGKTLPAGQTWPQFLAQCRGSLPKTAAAAPATVVKPPVVKPPVSAPAKTAAAPRAAGQPSAAQIAARSRQKQCSQNYQADKAANKLAGQSWPKYYSACNARLKG